MALSLVTREDAAKRLAQLPGAPSSVEVLSDLVRAEVHARQHAPRAATLARVARLLAPAVELEAEAVFTVAPDGEGTTRTVALAALPAATIPKRTTRTPP